MLLYVVASGKLSHAAPTVPMHIVLQPCLVKQTVCVVIALVLLNTNMQH